jgi:hypothetical protein
MDHELFNAQPGVSLSIPCTCQHCMVVLDATVPQGSVYCVQEAMKFPLIGSVSLFGLFLAIKFLPREWLQYIITFYFCALGTFAIGGMDLARSVHCMMCRSLLSLGVGQAI